MLKSILQNRNAPLLLPLASCLLFFIGFEMGGYQFVLRNICAEFSIPPSGIGVIAAIQSLGFVLTPLLFGNLTDRTGKKRALRAFMLVFILGCALCAISKSMWVFVAGISLIGIGFCMCECIATAALTELYPQKSARYINLTQALLCFGAVASPILTQWSMKTLFWSWRSMFFICGIGVAVLFMPICLTRFKESKPRAQNNSISFIPFLKSSVLKLLLVSIMFYVGLESGIGFFLESLFALRLSNETLGAYAISSFWLCMALSRIAYSLLPISAKKTVIFCLFESFVLFIILSVSKSQYFSLAICALIGFAFGPIWSLLVDFAAKEFPHNTGGVIGLMSSSCGLGSVIFTSIIGFVSGNLGIHIAFSMFPFVAILTCAITCITFKKIKSN